MASPSVKENIILAITPTLDGVCGMLLYIILNFDIGQIEYQCIYEFLPSWQKFINTLIFNLANIKIQNSKIIYNNIPHTPSKVGVMARIIFSFTLGEAMSVRLVKACALR